MTDCYLVGCRCRSHRNRRHIADGQVAGSNVGFEASSSGGRLIFVSLLLAEPSQILSMKRCLSNGRFVDTYKMGFKRPFFGSNV